MIRVTNLTKKFGQLIAVNGLNLEIEAGDIVGFLGPNGAGKSTTMKMLTGFLEPSSGQIEICQLDIAKQPLKIKQAMGYLPEGTPAYGEMTVVQFLTFIAQVRGLKGQYKKTRLQKVVEQVQLGSVLNKQIDNLSKGFKRRVGLAQAILHDPKVLILDEPTDGLDPNQKHHVRQLILNLAQDKVVIISTHLLEEVSAVCNRAIIIDKGKKLFDGTPQALASESPYHQAITLEFDGEKPDTSQLRLAPGVTHIIERSSNKISIIGHESYDNLFPQIFDIAHLQGWQLKGIYSEQGQLDDVFRKMTEEAR